MAQLNSSKVVEPYGEVNVFTEDDGRIRVKATILMKPEVEGAQTGLAIDGSKSMSELFGGAVAISDIFGGKPNLVEPMAQTLAEYLANFDSDGETTVIYWACGKFGDDLQILGDMDAQVARGHPFPKPTDMGTGTKLLPAIRHFTEERFKDAPWGIYVLLTDGLIEDVEEVKQYTRQLAEEMAANQRGFTKLVLIGLGTDGEFYYKNNETGEKLGVDQAEPRMFELEEDPNWEKSPAWSVLEDLDDLDEDPDYGNIQDSKGEVIDIWDYKLAANIKTLEEIFAEVVSAHSIIAPTAQIVGSDGIGVKPTDRLSYADGLPSLLQFTMAAGNTSFTLTVNENEITQPIA
jgi:hypothetical protein